MSIPAKKLKMRNLQPASEPSADAFTEADLKEQKTVMEVSASSVPVAKIQAQQNRIDELLALYQSQQFKKLKQALRNYRQDYLANAAGPQLPPVLLDWERQHREQQN